MGREWYPLVAVTGYVLAVAARALPLVWSPLPATLDGFRYARLAETTLATVRLAPGTAADEVVFLLELVVAGSVTGIGPLRLAQPFVAAAGGAVALVAIAYVHRIGRERGWPANRIRLAAALAALAVAIEGLYLRRTGVPDEGALALLVVALLALSAHRALAGGRPAWAVVTGVFVLVLPPLHNLGALVGVLTLTAIAALHLTARPDRRRAVGGVVLVAGAWAYFLGYFALMDRVGVPVVYTGLLGQFPGVVVAWLLALALGVVWFRATTERARRITFLGLLGSWFLVVGANLLRPVYPGTVPTPPVVAAMVLVLAVPVLLASRATWALSRGTGWPLLGMLAAAVVLVFYTLTTALTPTFFGAVLRVQTYAHLPVLVGAGLAAAGLTGGARVVQWSWVRTGVVGLLIVALVLTAPLAYVDLDTAAHPSTTTEAEFRAAGFAAAHVPGEVATDDPLVRLLALYYERPIGRLAPIRRWGRGGPAPACSVLGRQSWTTTGANLFPAAPVVISSTDYMQLRTGRGLVWSGGAAGGVDLVVPTRGGSTEC